MNTVATSKRLAVGWRSLATRWNDFFFTPQSPTPIALYRILYGLLIMADLALLHGDWLTWYGAHGLLSVETFRKMSGPANLNLFLIWPQGDGWIEASFWVFLLFALFLTVGFLSRFSSCVVFIFLSSIQRRNWYILHSGDTLLLVMGFFLMFAPTGAAISVDRLVRICRGKEGADVPPCSPWVQRLIQIQAAVVYFSTFCWKTVGSDWVDGTAMYYTTRLLEFQRFPMPTLESGVIVKLTTWSALLIEFALGLLIWVRKLRYWILLLGICLHLSIEYSMNIPLFQWIAMATYVTFIDPRDISRAWAGVRKRAVSRLGYPMDVFYDSRSARSVRLVNVLRSIDIFGRLKFVERQGQPGSQIASGARLLEGFKGLIPISHLVPLLWWLAPVALVFQRSRQPVVAVKAAK